MALLLILALVAALTVVVADQWNDQSSPETARDRPLTCNGGTVRATDVGCPVQVPAEDANNDGLVDVRHRWERGVTTSLFQADGSHRSVTFPFPTPKYPYRPPQSRWVSGDFNGDGRTDLLHGWPAGADIWVSRGDGRYTIVPLEVTTSHRYGDGAWKAGDITNDGLDDVVHVGMGQVTTWAGRIDGRRTKYQYRTPAVNYPYDVGQWELQDFNNDGRADLLHQLASGLNIWKSNGDGTYNVQAVEGPTTTYPYGAGDWRFADISGDGRVDLIHASTSGLYTWLSAGDGLFKVVQAPRGRYDYGSGSWRPGDITGDGLADIVHEYGARLDSWISRGDGTYSVVVNQLKGPLRQRNVSGEWRVRDVTGDRKADVISWWQDKVAAWISRGDGRFTQLQ